MSVAQRARELLAAVPDPEIPVVSIAELGILREVNESADGVEVVITPTYNGCPAMEQIAQDVRSTLDAHHIRATVVTRLAPAWTTDWINDNARAKLREFGIAPPGAAGSQPTQDGNVIRFAQRTTQTEAIPCPHCGSTNTTETSHFGSTACKALYRCLDCLEPFDYFKPY